MDRNLIEPLMLKALNGMQDSTQREFCERFAALIAEECAKIVETRGPAMHGPAPVAAIIREKFGVKP